MNNYNKVAIPASLDGLVVDSQAGNLAMLFPHTHVQLEFNLVIRGNTRCVSGNRYYDMPPRTLAFFFPDQEHMLFDYSPDFRMWTGIFNPSLAEGIDSGNREPLGKTNPPGYFCRMLDHSTAQYINSIADDLSRRTDDPVLMNAGLRFLLLRAWEAYIDADVVPDQYDIHPSVAKAARLLQQKDADFGVEALAENVGLSSSRLSHLFREQIGMTIPAFRNRRRIDRFIKLFGLGQRKTMLQVALEVGFGSYSQFHRVFKVVTGLTPAEYLADIKSR